LLSNNINLRKIGMMLLIFSLVFTGMGASLGTPVSYAASVEVYVASNGDDTTGDGTKTAPYATLQKAYQAIIDIGTIYVLDNITLSPQSGSKFLEFSGGRHITITTAPGVAGPAVIERNGSGTLIDLIDAQLTLKNIIIDGKNIGSAGRIVNVYNSSSLTIEEGAILRNNNIINELPASAIYLRDDQSTVKMTGGEITGNKYGGTKATAAILLGKGTFTMTGGLITANSGGGVEISSGQFSLSGNARITGNTIVESGQSKDRNVNLVDPNLLTLSGPFTGKAGITAQGRMTAGSQFGQATELDLPGLENLVADNSPLLAAYGSGKALVWEFKNVLTQPANDGETMGTRPTLKGETLPNAKLTIVLVNAADPSSVVTKEATADGNGNWVFTFNEELGTGAYTVEVTASKDNTQSLIESKGLIVVVDKTKLKGKHDEIAAENLIEAEYTQTSWKALDEAMKKAEEVLGKQTASQDEVDAALAELEKARNELTRKPEVTVDKTKLQGKHDELIAKNLKEPEYTGASWKTLDEAMKKAEEVLINPTVTQDEVDQALTALEQAEKDLVKLGGELDNLDLVGLNNDGTQPIQLDPVFDPSQYKNYQGTVTNDVYGISLNPKAKYPDDTQVKVFVNGKEYPADQWDNLPLEEGKENVIKVGVYDKTGQPINEYTYTIFRESAVPADNNLGSLVPSVGSLSPAFDPNQDSYTMSVSNSVYQIQLTPTALDPNAMIQIRVNDGEWKEVSSGQISDYLALNVGLNNIVVKVTGKDGSIKEYTVKVTRETSSNTGGGSTGNTGGTTPPPTDNTNKPGNIITTVNGSNVSFASGTVNGEQATVTIDKNKLSGILADGEGHKLGIRVPGNGDAEVRGLTLEDLKKIADTGSSLEIEDVLAIYPVPAGQLDVNNISKQFGNAPISDIAANIKIKRSADDLAKLAREKATQGGYELLVHPVDLDLTFMHDGKTDRAGLLKGYTPKYIALPESIDPNRITTGVIVNPDGSVFHVPTVVTKVNNRYFALINDLRSSGTYSVIWNPQDFEDVQYHWGRADVNNIAARLDLKGNGDNTFSPNRHVTRSEFAEIVVLSLGLMRQDATQNIYPDVPSTAWYRNAVALADEFDIVRGYTDGSFKGSQQITREQGFAMIARAYRLIQSENVPSPEQIASTLASYEDGDKVASWAKADVAQLIAAGIIQGNGPDHLSPKAQMTRAEVTALIARMLKLTNLIDK